MRCEAQAVEFDHSSDVGEIQPHPNLAPLTRPHNWPLLRSLSIRPSLGHSPSIPPCLGHSPSIRPSLGQSQLPFPPNICAQAGSPPPFSSTCGCFFSRSCCRRCRSLVWVSTLSTHPLALLSF